jgi:sodium transport system permease protein
MSQWRNLLVVFQKELTDSLRDRRTLFGALFYPLLGPVLMVVLLSVILRTFSDQAEQPLDLPVIGAEHAPQFILYLQQNRVAVQPGPADPQAEVRTGNLDVVLIIPPGFGDDLAAGRPATVQLVFDDTRQSAEPALRRTQGLIEGYSRQIGVLRLLARGVSPSLVNALAVEEINLATPQGQAALFINIMPYFIIFSIFIGGSGVTIDATAGERERGTLEPLVINPVSRGALVLGKLGVALIFTLQAVVETLVGFGLMINSLSLDELGLRLSLSAASLLGTFLVALPMTLLAAALQFIIATFTRSYREAQVYLQILPLIPALPGMFLAFVPVKADLWTMLIPTFGQQLLINQFMRGEPVSALNALVASAVALAVGAVLVYVAIRLFSREQVLFAK